MPKTLLVIDDSRTIREAARLALAGEGWTVVEAANEDDAFRELLGATPSAVLCDADLAGEGYSFCDEIRSIPGAKGIPVLLMGPAVDRQAARAAGASGTVPKPFSSEELSDALRRAAYGPEGADGEDFGDDEPLTLEELSGPFQPATPPAAGAAEPAVEIIDLDEGEEYDELELVEDLEPFDDLEAIDDLEPVAPAPAAAQPGWDTAGWIERLAADPVTASGGTEPGAAAHAVGFARATPAVETGSGPVEFPDDLGFGIHPVIHLPPPPEEDAPAAAAPREEAFVETPDSYLQPPEPPPAEFPPAEPPPAPCAPDTAALAATVEATAGRAVREALTRSLDADRLGPLVERVVERVVWEVVPQLAERLIREAIEKLKSAPPE